MESPSKCSWLVTDQERSSDLKQVWVWFIQGMTNTDNNNGEADTCPVLMLHQAAAT